MAMIPSQTQNCEVITELNIIPVLQEGGQLSKKLTGIFTGPVLILKALTWQ